MSKNINVFVCITFRDNSILKFKYYIVSHYTKIYHNRGIEISQKTKKSLSTVLECYRSSWSASCLPRGGGTPHPSNLRNDHVYRRPSAKQILGRENLTLLGYNRLVLLNVWLRYMGKFNPKLY